MRHHPAELISKKRDGAALAPEEIADLVGGVVDHSLGDAQLGAFLMAVCWRGMSAAETAALTRAMCAGGSVLDWSAVPGAKVDKHSTGGVGDKVSLLLAPWVAAAGVRVPMISGRGLGHTGGTIDKLHAIPGYRTDLAPADLARVVAACGYAMAEASAELAPADRRMYAIRDVTGTVESVPLITASILSKKLAAGIDALVLDVKCGRAAFMKTERAARELAQSLVETGRGCGLDVVALLTEMDRPLGRAVGNALEVAEVVACLRGEGPADVLEVARALGAEMLVLARRCATRAEALSLLDDLMAQGRVREALAANVTLQGGDASFLDDPAALGTAPVVEPVRASASGRLADIDPLAIGTCVCALGGGRRQPDDVIDPRVGVRLRCDLGAPVAEGDVLAEVHAADAAGARWGKRAVENALRIAPEAPEPRSAVLARIP